MNVHLADIAVVAQVDAISKSVFLEKAGFILDSLSDKYIVVVSIDLHLLCTLSERLTLASASRTLQYR